MRHFSEIEEAPADPLFGLRKAFLADTRKEKINLSLGAYKTSDLKPYILGAVRKAEAKILEEGLNKEYLPIDGDADFVKSSKTLVFGENLGRVFGAQSVGGTGALRVGADFLVKQGCQRLYISDPTWVNHHNIFRGARLEVKPFPYYGKEGFDFEGMCAAVKKMEKGSALLLQGCCHNPTGFDPSAEQWVQLGDLIEEQGVIPFFDFAYQGFGDGLAEDAAAIHSFLKRDLDFLVASSFSKNMGLYGERVGGLFVVCENEEVAKRVGTQVKPVIRSLYSNPPLQGGRIVRTVLMDEALRKEWEQELADMRFRITQMRRALVDELDQRVAKKFDHIADQKGMFSYTGLRVEQVERLTAEYGIYMPKDGRVNVAGLNATNLPFIAEAIATV